MSIEFEIKYTEEEYLSAAKEKLAVMPNKMLHTYLPTIFLTVLICCLIYFNSLSTWWGILSTVFVSVYAIPTLFGDWLMPKVALVLARKKKLEDTYTFKIDKYVVNRTSENGMLCASWDEIISTDFYSNNVFINLKSGSILIPKARLSETEFDLLRSYATRT